jgi:hypothetical protein
MELFIQLLFYLITRGEPNCKKDFHILDEVKLMESLKL